MNSLTYKAKVYSLDNNHTREVLYMVLYKNTLYPAGFADFLPLQRGGGLPGWGPITTAPILFSGCTLARVEGAQSPPQTLTNHRQAAGSLLGSRLLKKSYTYTDIFNGKM